jgi:hypothetical protein
LPGQLLEVLGQRLHRRVELVAPQRIARFAVGGRPGLLAAAAFGFLFQFVQQAHTTQSVTFPPR